VESQRRIERVLESIVKVQGEIINKGENSRIQALLSQTMTSIGSSMNGVITQETEVILQEFKNNFESIKNKFAELK
jgi:type III secretory pathway lipoprotein EscJ